MVIEVDPVLLAMPEAVMFRGASVGPLLPEPPQAAAASAIKGMAMRRMSFSVVDRIRRCEVTLQDIDAFGELRIQTIVRALAPPAVLLPLSCAPGDDQRLARATMRNVKGTSSSTCTRPPAAVVGLIPNSDCLTVSLPSAVSVSPRKSTLSGTTIGFTMPCQERTPCTRSS